MTEQSKALQVALAYHEAWSSQDLDKAMEYVAEDVVLHAPDGRIDGSAAYRESVGHFVAILKGTTVWAAFGDDETAVLVYDTETSMLTSAPGAEHVSVRDGKIISSRLIFDRLPFTQPAAASGAITGGGEAE
jgi:ketosteroid isomerase-like protein